jgi:hypothetical protein
MAQVDRRLTKVNSVDRIIRVNKPGWKPGASQVATLNPNDDKGKQPVDLDIDATAPS